MSHLEYLPGMKAGSKIDLASLPSARFEKDKKPKPETYLPELRAQLSDLAERLNSEHGYFFNAEAQLEMSGPDLEVDRGLVAEKEAEWAGEVGKSVEDFLAARAKNPASITEMATTLLFDKILGGEFVVVRASTFDDYENGADQLIIDKKTGAVICGLDDVLIHTGEGSEKKEGKIAAKMKHGGASIKYGATIEAGSLKRRSLKHIPLFYFSLSKNDLDSLLSSLAANKPEPDGVETMVYAQLVNSLVAQASKFQADASLSAPLKENLEHFSPSLRKMQKRVR